MIAAKCSSFTSKPWNHWPKQLAALCVSWGNLFPTKPMIHLQMAPWISRQLHPQPKNLTIPVLAVPARMWTQGWHGTLYIFRNSLLFLSVSVLGWVVGRRKTCGGHCSQWWGFVLEKHCDTAGQHPQGNPGWVWLLLGWLFCLSEEHNLS